MWDLNPGPLDPDAGLLSTEHASGLGSNHRSITNVYKKMQFQSSSSYANYSKLINTTIAILYLFYHDTTVLRYNIVI